MDSHATLDQPRLAWQPLTARGVAAFAKARFTRLWLVQFLVALLVAITVVWFLNRAWFPIVRTALDALPAQGEIRAGQLHWQGEQPQLLAEGPFLALAVDLQHSGHVRSPAHIYVELGQRTARLYSLFGYHKWPYSPDYWIACNRQDLLPWWGAWSPAILALVSLGVIAGLFLAWTSLATLYAGPVWLLAFFTNRQASLTETWRLSGAALMPGALFMCLMLGLYGLGILDLLLLLLTLPVHLLIPWLYLWMATLRLPLHPAAAALKNNPFTPAPARPPENAAAATEPPILPHGD